MRVIDLISQLNEQDIRLWLENGQLRFSAPKGAMTESVRDDINRHRTEIMDFLAQTQQSENRHPITPVNHSQLQPLSFSQERIWFVCQLEPDNTAFHLQNLFRIRGPLDKSRLERVLNAIVERHSILRTVYLQTTTGTWQKILPAPKLQLNCRKADNATEQAQIRELIREEAARPFALEHGEVFRHCLLEFAEDDFLLLTTIHHIATDGWSMALMAGEISHLYPHIDDPQTLQAVPIQYQDFAVWQRRQQAGAGHLAWWKQQLADVPVLRLPCDLPQPQDADSSGAAFSFTLDKTTTDALQQLARTHNATLYMVLLALFSTLLYRLTRQDDFCIGTPVAGRSNSQLESVIGCFVNMLAIRCRHQAHSFSEHLAAIRDSAQAAFAHQETPFEQVVREVLTTRDLGITPIFQVMFALQSIDLEQQEQIGDINIQAISAEKHASLYDLSLSANLWNGQILAELNYKTSLFSAASIEAMADNFQRLVSSVLQAPKLNLHELDCISPQDRQQQLEDWNNTDVLRDELATVQQYIEQQAQQHPHTIAVVFEQQQLSYQQLDQQANRLAHYLLEQQAGPGIIGVYMERSLELPVVLLAILKTGSAYLPLDLSFPPQRLEFVCRDAGVQCVVSQAHLDGWVMPESITRINPEQNHDALQQQPDSPPALNWPARPLFNLIYTSGSTGEPKGVLISHDAMINRLLWMQEYFAIDANDRILHKTPYSFDVSVWEIFWPLMNGAQLVIAQPYQHKNPDYLAETVQQQHISVMHFVPSMLGFFLQYASPENCRSLKRVFCSGEALSATLCRRFLETLPDTELYNLYGPTEAAIDVTCQPCTAEMVNVPIGRPIANTRLYLLDEYRQLLPTGATGEIHISGRNLAEGYLNRPELTDAAFVAHPFIPGERLYKTGDLGRFDRQGRLYYLGRTDQQVKIRGFRIELPEIEQQLNLHPDINESLLLANDAGEDNQQLVAYFIGNRADIDSSELRTHLQQRLPEFMIPGYFIQLEQWPQTSHGKTDRRLLPAPRDALTPRELQPPRTATEKVIAEIWMELLDLPEVGVYDNFFSLGGHSLLAGIAMTRIQQHFNTSVALADIFADPCIATIADAIDNSRRQSIIDNEELPDDEEEYRL